MQLDLVLLWIEESFLARFVATTPLIYPLTSAIHLIGISLLVGSIVMVDLRLLGFAGAQFDAALSSFVRISLFGFSVAVTTGVLLASVRIVDYAANPAFQAKMLILLAAGLNAALLRMISGYREMSQMVGKRMGRIAALASLFLWTSAILAGRWIAFV